MRYLVLLLFLAACSAEPVPGLEEMQGPGTISIIFDAHPDYRHNLPEGIAQYIDDHFIKRSLRPKATGDTLTIITEKDVLELTHTYPHQAGEDGPITYSQLRYFIQKGDTLRFSYDGYKPHAEVLNRATRPYDLNYDLASWGELYERKVPVRFYMFGFVFDPNWTEAEREENFLRHVNQINQQDLDEIALEDAFLDSLFAAALISEHAYVGHKSINYFRVMDSKEKRERVARYVNQPGAALMAEQGGVESAGFVPQVPIEELAAMGSIRYALNDYIAYRFQVPTVSETYDGAGLRYPDYPIKFDSTLQAPWLSEQVKAALLVDDMQGIMEEYPVAQRLRYLSKFKAFVADTVVVNYFTKKYAVTAGEEEEILLENRNGIVQPFSDVLAAHAGKVVYVDWWAGWCGPCHQAMPDLKALADTLAGQEAVVLYISIDEENELWAASADSLLPGAEALSYRVLNKFMSKQYEAFNIQYIPRYFLIDKQGRVVEEYAPAPDEERLLDMITALAAE